MTELTTVTTIVATIIAVASFASGVSQYRRKIHLEIFRAYADRYNSIVSPDLYERWQLALNGEREHWPELTETMVKYLNLTWEEFYLSRDGLIPRKLWKLWLPEIQRVLNSDFAKSVIERYDFHFTDDIMR